MTYPFHNNHFLDTFSVEKSIISGHFGTIFHVKNVHENTDYMVQRVAVKNNIPSKLEVSSLVEKYSKINDELVICFQKAWWETPDFRETIEESQIHSSSVKEDLDDTAESKNSGPVLHLYLLTEHFSSQTLADYFQMTSTSSEFQNTLSSLFVTDLLNALEYIHEKGVIHRNIRPESVFVKAIGPNWSRLKIGNFGFRNMVPDHSLSPYLAPELVPGAQFTQSSDYFALGLVGLEIINLGVRDFDKEVIFEKRRRGDELEGILNPEDRIHKLILMMTDLEPEKRKKAVDWINESD